MRTAEPRRNIGTEAERVGMRSVTRHNGARRPPSAAARTLLRGAQLRVKRRKQTYRDTNATRIADTLMQGRGGAVKGSITASSRLGFLGKVINEAL